MDRRGEQSKLFQQKQDKTLWEPRKLSGISKEEIRSQHNGGAGVRLKLYLKHVE